MSYDAIVIGAGHNGLVCACYLAKAGKKVVVVERSPQVGGACITEELYPGCQFSTFAYNANGPGPRICNDLGIGQNWDIRPADPVMFFPFPDQDHVMLFADPQKSADGLARFGPEAVDGFFRYLEFMNLGKQLAQELFFQPPLTHQQLYERCLGTDFQDVLEAWLTRSHWDVLGDYFDSEKLRTVFARADDVGYPTAVGSLLAEAIESANDGAGPRGISGVIAGGMGTITQTLAEAFLQFGGELLTDTEVTRITVSATGATGVALQNGRRLLARHIISNADPKRTFLKLLDESDCPADLRKNVERLKTRAGNMKFHAVLKGLPQFTAMPDEWKGNPQAISGVRIGSSLAYFEQAWGDAMAGRPSTNPVMSLQLPTVVMPELAPPGKHMLGIWLRYGPGELSEGSWNDLREPVTENLFRILEEYAPGFRDLVEWCRLYTPEDIESQTGITGASIRHLDMTIDQMLHRRPLPSWSAYQSPIPNLWLCGSGTHPCGSVTGAPGHNAAHALLSADAK